MILLIDIGNTNTVLGVYDKNEYLYTSRINSESQFEVELKSLIKYNIDEIAISSVVPIFTK